MSPIGSSSEEADSLFKSSSETTKHYKDLVSKLLENEESDSSLSEPEDFTPYYQFWQLPIEQPKDEK